MLRLELPDRAIDLDDMGLGDVGPFVTEVDYGYPELRELVSVANSRRGTIDRTEYYGARVITITGKLGIDWAGGEPRSWEKRDRFTAMVAPFMAPSARPYLYANYAGAVRRIQVRASDWSQPEVGGVMDWSISFKAPTGTFEGEEHIVTVLPERPVPGRTYNLIHPRVYPEDGDGTVMFVENMGTEPADWIARIYGPCKAPEIELVGYGQTPSRLVSLSRLDMPDFMISTPYGASPQRTFIEVDSAEHTVLANGIKENSRWSALDWNRTDWWKLPPGRSAIRMRINQQALGWWQLPSHMVFSWRDAYLL